MTDLRLGNEHYMPNWVRHLQPSGRRLWFRLIDKYGLSEEGIEHLLHKEGLKPEVLNTMNVLDYIFLFLTKKRGMNITKDQLSEMIKSWDLEQKAGFKHKSAYQLELDYFAPAMPTSVSEAQDVSYADWERGLEVGEMMLHACRWLLAYAAAEQKKLVVYGRDGEIIYDALLWLKRRMGGSVQAKYIILSRNQMSILEKMERLSRKPEMRAKKAIALVYVNDDHERTSIQVSWREYEAFLKYVTDAVDSPHVVHVDTGCSGTIPRRLHELLYTMGKGSFGLRPDIRMLRSTSPEYQIPGVDVTDVVDRIEHQAQTARRTYSLTVKPNPQSYLYCAFRFGVIHKMRELLGEGLAKKAAITGQTNSFAVPPVE